jgi:hypothetical protein
MFSYRLLTRTPRLNPSRVQQKRSIAALSALYIPEMFGVLEKPYNDEGVMLEMTKYLHPRKTHSKNFGDVYETYVINHRIWFKKDKIIIGEFPDCKRVEECYNIGRIPEYFIDRKGDVSDNKRNFVEDENNLARYLPSCASDALGGTFFMAGKACNATLPALKIPAVYNYLPRTSKVVKSISFLKDHNGVIFEYDWDNLRDIEKFRYDLYIGIKVLEGMADLRPPSSDE